MGFNGDLYPSNASIVMTTKGDMVDYDTERQRLGIGSTGQVLTVASSLPTWATLTTADSVLTTQGDVLYESASGLARLGFGTSGHVLTTKGTGQNPVWEASGGGGASTANVQNQGNFTTTSTSPVDVTNYSLTLPTTTAQSDDCICVFSGVMTNSVSDAFNFELVKNTTAIASSTCEPTTPYGHNSVVVANTICDADGDTLKLTLHSAGGNSCTFKSGTETTSGMTVFAV